MVVARNKTRCITHCPCWLWCRFILCFHFLFCVYWWLITQLRGALPATGGLELLHSHLWALSVSLCSTLEPLQTQVRHLVVKFGILVWSGVWLSIKLVWKFLHRPNPSSSAQGRTPQGQLVVGGFTLFCWSTVCCAKRSIGQQRSMTNEEENCYQANKALFKILNIKCLMRKEMHVTCLLNPKDTHSVF